MATSRAKTTEAAPEDKTTEATTEATTKGAETTQEAKMVKVHNPHPRYHYVQPGTGIRIGAEETKELRDDAWLNLQVNAGVLKKV